MPGKFEVYEDRSGKHRFRLRDSTGVIVASGEAHQTRAGALATIDRIKRDVAEGPIQIIDVDKGEELNS